MSYRKMIGDIKANFIVTPDHVKEIKEKQELK
jgi:hypothetical protein